MTIFNISAGEMGACACSSTGQTIYIKNKWLNSSCRATSKLEFGSSIIYVRSLEAANTLLKLWIGEGICVSRT